MSPAALSLVVVNWNTRELLEACLQALPAAAADLDLEIVVVDNASTDGSADMVKARFPRVRVVANARNCGFAAAANQGLRLAKGRYLGLLNPDTVVEPRAFNRLLDALEGASDALAAAPMLLNPDRSLQPSGRCFPRLTLFWLEGLLPRAGKQSAWWLRQRFGRTDFSQPARCDEASGACFVTRRETFEKTGWLDERYFVYFEEVDWFLRAGPGGRSVLYVPEARVVHHWGAAAARVQGESSLMNYRSAFRFWRKHRGRLAELSARSATLLHAGLWLLAAGLGVRSFRGRAKQFAQIFLLALGVKP